MAPRRLVPMFVCLACGLLWIAATLHASLHIGSTQDGTIPRVSNPQLASDLVNLPGDLRGVAVPGPGDLSDFIRDMPMALALGKSLFWDMQVGSDGVQACASCHFRAGADPRSKNQISPGLLHAPAADMSYSTAFGPNGQLTAEHFPLTKLLIPGVRGEVGGVGDSNDAVSSQGVHHLGKGVDPLGFSVAGTNTRRVEPRNTPSMINAVFNHRQFWDGRAENVFNGINHLGARDSAARVYRADDPKYPTEFHLKLINSSLASQAVAPIVSALEMSEEGRTPAQVGSELARRPRKIYKQIKDLRPLAKQQVHPADSVLGAWSRWPNAGLTTRTYDEMIRTAFHEHWWRSSRLIRVHDNGSREVVDRVDDDPTTEEYTLIQYNFAMFLGLAVQLYERTLVSDDTPWDRFRRAHPSSSDPLLNPWVNLEPVHISRLALFGAHLFNDRTKGPTNVRCSNCHEQAELTDASVRRIASAVNGPVRNRDGNIIDKGFNNIGLRPTDNDLGVGATDAFGPLSFSRRKFPLAPPGPTETFDGALVSKGFGLQGAFKVPSLRNVALTAPYFHNGEALTLRQVVEFYSRGGNVFPVKELDGTTIEPLGTPNLTTAEVDAIVAFMETLTDERVLYRRAPFDHPQLFVPNGHPVDHLSVLDANKDGRADDLMVEIPAVGAAGGLPLPGFLEGVFGPQTTPVASVRRTGGGSRARPLR